MRSEILKNEDSANAQFAHYAIDRAHLAQIQSWPAGAHALPPRAWLRGGASAQAGTLSAGDMVGLAVWENGDNKLLTSEGAPSVALQATQINDDGTLFVPYAGPVHVAGLSIETARQRVQDALTALLPAAQVQLSRQPGMRNTADLVSGVASPRSIDLSQRPMTVLSAITEGGGVSTALKNPQVRLMRGKTVYEISMKRLTDDPTLDTGIRRGDKLIITEDPRYFLSLGAAGREEIVPFPRDKVTALEAITLAGGVNDSRADPKGILILREYPSTAVGPNGPTHTRVIFSIDLTTTDGLFSAQNFYLQPQDVVLATESPVVKAQTLFGLFNTTVSSAYRVSNL
ncbi:polysaccharide biosynthesis/export family protein [Thioclava sp. GXIMD4216]|uniref:Polysaccharide biosynthesis/export family protein n=1 Tax=Thioclava litoralis TaxID=3076557 RepID=A0ABZ1DZM5_9RHOB|nr:polysaccharide biosynthesis/export family protein [Thioclava sp. FTW29]